MFRTGMRDSNRKRVTLRDKTVKYDLFSELIYTAYTDTIRVDEDNLIPLIALAQEYQFPAVIALASHQLHEHVTVNNAISTARFVEATLDLPLLRAYCFCVLAIYVDSLQLTAFSKSKSLSYRGFFPGSGRVDSDDSDIAQDESYYDTPILRDAQPEDLDLLKSLVQRLQTTDATISSLLRIALRTFDEKGESELLLELTESETPDSDILHEPPDPVASDSDSGSESELNDPIVDGNQN
jgi:hypothetical protein